MNNQYNPNYVHNHLFRTTLVTIPMVIIPTALPTSLDSNKLMVITAKATKAIMALPTRKG